MQIAESKFALNVAKVVSGVYALCALFVFLFPGFSETLMSALTHTKASIRDVTIGGFVLGIIQVAVYSWIAAWLFARVFNKNLK